MRDSRKRLRRGERWFLLGWCAAVIALGAYAGIALTLQQGAHRKAAVERHAARMGVGTAEPGQTPPERTPPPGHEKDVPQEIKTGIYLDRIAELSIVGSSWKADFYVWFKWSGESLNPGESFQVVNGEIVSKTLVEKRDQGAKHYALYRTVAVITKKFDEVRFPRDDHLLTISIEDAGLQSYQLRYMTEDAASDISSRVAVPGYKVLGKVTSVKPHSYRTSRGNPSLPAGYQATYSQFAFGVWIGRPSWGLFFKLTAVLYAAVAMALVALFIRSSGDRLALQTGAMFAAAANTYITATLIPATGVATLADQINWIGIACIGIALIEGVIYQRRLENVEERAPLANLLDVSTFVLLAVLFVAINIAVPAAASV